MDWRAEAAAVIHDVKPYVADIAITDETESKVLLKIETYEGRILLVTMDSNGFSFCDEVKNDEQRVYETINALLDANSCAYRRAFAAQLIARVSSLVNEDASNQHNV